MRLALCPRDALFLHVSARRVGRAAHEHQSCAADTEPLSGNSERRRLFNLRAQCIVKFQTVPKAKRLVITNVSAQLGQNLDSFVIEGNGGAFFVQKGYPTAGNLDAPIMVYFEAGAFPLPISFVQDATQHISLVVTFVGYIIPLQ